MNSSQRNSLRKTAHGLKPIVMLGHNGVSSEFLAALEQAIESNELIKIKFQDFKDDKKELSEKMANAVGAEVVSIIGNILTLYREAKDPDKRIIKLPKE